MKASRVSCRSGTAAGLGIFLDLGVPGSESGLALRPHRASFQVGNSARDCAISIRRTFSRCLSVTALPAVRQRQNRVAGRLRHLHYDQPRPALFQHHEHQCRRGTNLNQLPNGQAAFQFPQVRTADNPLSIAGTGVSVPLPRPRLSRSPIRPMERHRRARDHLGSVFARQLCGNELLSHGSNRRSEPGAAWSGALRPG